MTTLGGLGGAAQGGLKGAEAGLAGDADVRVSQLKAARDYAQQRTEEVKQPTGHIGYTSPPADHAEVYQMIAEVLGKAL